MTEESTTPSVAEPMSSSYADGLSPYDHKGKLGLQEIFDTDDEVEKKVKILADWLKQSKHAVFHTGAGISTSAGIPDFRGPEGVWTLEKRGEKPKFNKSFNEVVPTKTHLALKHLVSKGFAKFVISQNIDGLHLRSGLSRENLAELHGNMFTEQCDKCEGLFVRSVATTSVGCKYLGRTCPGKKGRLCRGKIKDTILDWEHQLPIDELLMSEWHSNLADLSVTLGTTMQIIPSGNLPLLAKKRGGKLVICNLQPTKHDKKADLIIHTYVDKVMEKLLVLLGEEETNFNEQDDPTKKAADQLLSWDFTKKVMASTKRQYLDQCTKLGKRNSQGESSERKKKNVKIEDEENLDNKKMENTPTDLEKGTANEIECPNSASEIVKKEENVD